MGFTPGDEGIFGIENMLHTWWRGEFRNQKQASHIVERGISKWKMASHLVERVFSEWKTGFALSGEGYFGMENGSAHSGEGVFGMKNRLRT